MIDQRVHWAIVYWLGVVVLTRAIIRTAPKQRRIQIAVFSVAVSAVSFWALWLVLPSVEERNRTIQILFLGSARKVESITIEPRYNDRYSPEFVELNLVQNTFRISDQADVDRVCHVLAESQRFFPNHPGAYKWACRMRIRTIDDRQLTCDVTNTQDGRNGLIIRAIYGWESISYRCDALGPILDELTGSSQALGKGRESFSEKSPAPFPGR